MDQGWSEILVFSYDGEYEDDYDFVDGLDFVIYNVSPVHVSFNVLTFSKIPVSQT